MRRKIRDFLPCLLLSLSISMLAILLVLLILFPQKDKEFRGHIDREVGAPPTISMNINWQIAEEPSMYSISQEDRELIARIIYREGNCESYDCQKMIGSVIFNRWLSGKWGNSFSDVIYAPGQFTTAQYVDYTVPTEIQYQVVDDIVQNGTNLPQHVLYFRAQYHFDWPGYTPYCSMDNTYFGF